MSLLSHLTNRFAAQPENLATEALAYVLEHHPAAANGMRALITQFGLETSSGLRFRTQHWLSEDQALPDLVGIDDDGSVPLLCEVKFWAGLTPNQPVTYFASLPAAAPGLLLFIAPEQRQDYLWGELCRRFEIAGTTLEQNATGDPGSRARAGQRTVAIVSWKQLIGQLQYALGRDADHVGQENLRQLEGLCDLQDREAFLPVTSEELSGGWGQRLLQYSQLIDDAVARLSQAGLANTTGLNRTATSRGFGRWLHLGSLMCLLRVDYRLWGHLAATPFWLHVSDGKAGTVPRVIADLRHATPPGAVIANGGFNIPLHLPEGADREVALDALFEQLQALHGRLTDANPPPEAGGGPLAGSDNDEADVQPGADAEVVGGEEMTDESFGAFVDQQEWIFAKTMPEIPHWYCLREKVPDDEAFDAAVRYIRETGYDGNWRGTVRRYLDHSDHVYWTMGVPVDETILINRQKLTDSEVERLG